MMVKNMILMVGLTAAVGMAAAEGIDFKLSGYGTIGAVVTNTDDAEFVSSTRQPRGASKSADIGVDTRLGLQGVLTLNPRFSVTSQLLALRRDGRETPVVEWLYAQAKPVSWLELRAGRLVLPLFLVSDSRNVGYTSHWLRAPAEVYGTFPVSSFDGAQAQTRASFGGTNLSLQISAGKAQFKGYNTVALDFKLEDIQSASLTAERGDWTARLGVTNSKTSISGFPFLLPSSRSIFGGAGLQYDNGLLLMMSEFVRRKAEDHGADSDAYYVSSGYRLGTFMPYAIYSQFTPKGDLFASKERGHTVALGLRWEAFKNTAIKAQWESTKPSTQFVHPTPNFSATAPKVSVLSIAADFVF